MRIIICKQNLFGGTDKLLDRLIDWLYINNYDVDIWNEDNVKLKKQYDISIIPSSQLGDLWEIRKRKITVDRVLIWILGTGTFIESYYNKSQEKRLFTIPLYFLKREATNTLKWLYNNNAIVFTDEVGLYNNLGNRGVDYVKKTNKLLVPIAINVPRMNENIVNRDSDIIRIVWLGRVSYDFKAIPIKHIIMDIEKYRELSNKDVCFTIIGKGDALEEIKEISKQQNYEIKFIDEIEYLKLDKYIKDNVDILIAMGTSALDGAKVGCPTVIVTPVRNVDKEEVFYRWVFESKGYSLGEFPGLDIETNQVRKSFETIFREYLSNTNNFLENKSYEYAWNFDADFTFLKLINRELPGIIDSQMWKHILFFNIMKKLKKILKTIYTTK